METLKYMLDDYYQDFIREIIFASTDSAYIWVVCFNRWLPGCELPRKAILKGLIDTTEYEFQREIQILREASQYKAIVKYYYHIQNSLNRWIFMEYCEKGSLNNFIDKQKEKGTYFAYPYIVWQFYWIADALALLHKSKRYHRDIKPDNIFVSDVEVFKLGDFGVSRDESLSSRSSETVIGTEFYMSPSLLDKFGLGKTDTKSLNPLKDDVWALGKTIFEAIVLETGIDFRWKEESYVMKFVNERFDRLSHSGYQPQLKNLIRGMMKFDETSRLSMQNVTDNLYKILESLWIDSFQTLAHDAVTVELSPVYNRARDELEAGSRETIVEKISLLSMNDSIYRDNTPNSYSYTPMREESKSETHGNCDIFENEFRTTFGELYKCSYCNNFIDENYFELECKHKYHKECIKKYVESRVFTENNTQNLLCVVCTKVLDLKIIIHKDLGLSQDSVLQIFKLTWREEKFACPNCNKKSKNSVLSSGLKPHFIRCSNCSDGFCSFCSKMWHNNCDKFDAYLEKYLSIYREKNKLLNNDGIF